MLRSAHCLSVPNKASTAWWALTLRMGRAALPSLTKKPPACLKPPATQCRDSCRAAGARLARSTVVALPDHPAGAGLPELYRFVGQLAVLEGVGLDCR